MNLLALALVPVIATHLEGPPTLEKVALDELPVGVQWITCFREFEAKQLRCYAAEPETMKLYYADVTIEE